MYWGLGVRQRMGDCCWSVWEVGMEGTVREVTGEMEEIHSIGKRPSLGSEVMLLNLDSVAPLCVSSYHPSILFLSTGSLYSHS